MLLASIPVLLAATPPPAGGGGAPAAPPPPAPLTLPGTDLTVLAVIAVVALLCVVLGLVLRARALAGDASAADAGVAEDASPAGTGTAAAAAGDGEDAAAPTTSSAPRRSTGGVGVTGPRALVVGVVVVLLAAALVALPGGSVLPDGKVLTAGATLRLVRSAVLLGGAGVAALVVRLAATLPAAAAARATDAVLTDRATGRDRAVQVLARAGGSLALVTVGLGVLSAALVLLVAGLTDHVAAAPSALLALALGAAVVGVLHARTGAAAALLPVLVALLAVGPLLGGEALGARGLVLPLVAPAVGVLLAAAGVLLVSVREDEGVLAAVDRGLFVPTVVTAVLTVVAAFAYLPATYGDPLRLSPDVAGMVAVNPQTGAALPLLVSNPRLAVAGAVLVGVLVAAAALGLSGRTRGRAAGVLAVLAVGVLSLTLLSNGVVTLGLFLLAVAGSALVASAAGVLTASAFAAVQPPTDAGGRQTAAEPAPTSRAGLGEGGSERASTPVRVRGVARALLAELAEVGAVGHARAVALTAAAAAVVGVALVGALFSSANAAINVAANTVTEAPGPLLVAAVVDYRAFSPLVVAGLLAGAATALAVRGTLVGPGRRGTLTPALLALSVPVAVGVALGVTSLVGLVVGAAAVAALGALLGAPAGAPAVAPATDPAAPAVEPTGGASLPDELAGAPTETSQARPSEAAGPLVVVVALVSVLITPQVVALLVGSDADGLLRLSVAGLAVVVAAVALLLPGLSSAAPRPSRDETLPAPDGDDPDGDPDGDDLGDGTDLDAAAVRADGSAGSDDPAVRLPPAR